MRAFRNRLMLHAAVARDGRVLRLPRLACVVLGVLMLFASACQNNDEPISLSFELLARDANADQMTPQQVTTPAYRLFQEAASWESYSLQLDQPAAAIDFAAQIVVAVYMGEKPTGGYGIAITAVELRGRTVRVSLEETEPPANAMLMQVITSPFALYRVVLPQGSTPSDAITSIEFLTNRGSVQEPLALKRLP